MESYQSLNIFISSANDVEKERNFAEDVINKINRTTREPLGITFNVIRWEHMLHLTPLPEETIQDEINKHVDKCDVFLLILYKRYGTVEKGRTKSNLEIEINRAIDRLLKERKIYFLTYFRKIPPDDDRGQQEIQVRKLREGLPKKGIWKKDYSEPEEFKEQLCYDLYKVLFRFRFSTKKHQYLTAFWDLGITDRHESPELAIVYPPEDRYFDSFDKDECFWQRRLVPNVVFEDFKAMQKIEKTLRLIGFRNFHFYSTKSIPPDILNKNRIWLCLPRNNRSLERLRQYQKIKNFDFIPKGKDEKMTLLWKSRATKNKFIEIKSPLSKYLKEQRISPDTKWNSDMGKIIAKDYAVISRFKAMDNQDIVIHGNLMEYFIAGIRGLGTWGAGWFIDRQYSHFRKLDSGQNYQVLLEVTYRDERIFSIRDVSNEPAEYFQNENSLKIIRNHIEEYQKSR